MINKTPLCTSKTGQKGKKRIAPVLGSIVVGNHPRDSSLPVTTRRHDWKILKLRCSLPVMIAAFVFITSQTSAAPTTLVMDAPRFYYGQYPKEKTPLRSYSSPALITTSMKSDQLAEAPEGGAVTGDEGDDSNNSDDDDDDDDDANQNSDRTVTPNTPTGLEQVSKPLERRLTTLETGALTCELCSTK